MILSSETLWTLRNCPLMCVTLHNIRRFRPKCFLHWKICLFSKICVFNNLLGPKRIVILFSQWLPENLVDPHKLFLEVCKIVKYDNLRIDWTNFFPLEEVPSFFENFRFQQRFGCFGKDLELCNTIAKIACGAEQNVTRWLPHWVLWQKLDQIFFLGRKPLVWEKYSFST